MDASSIPFRVHQCSKCQGGKEYYCESCPCDLCPRCKENHVKDLQTKDHNVVSYREQINYIPTQEVCLRHPSHVYTKYCEFCQVPVCNHCRKNRNHRQLDVGTSYETKRQQHKGTIHTIRSDALFYRPFLQPGIRADLKFCRTEFFLYKSEMLTKAQKLKDQTDYIQNDFMCNVFCDFDFKHRCLKQKIEMNRHIVSLQRFVHRYEQRVIRPVLFLSSIKTPLPQIHLTLHTSQLSMTESLTKEDVIGSLIAIQITEKGNRRVGNECLLKMMHSPEFLQSLTLTSVNRCYHISCVTSDWFWVSYRNNLILTNTRGFPLHRVEDSCNELYGLHTVNSESELIYIDWNYNINKLSKDMKTKTIFVKRTCSTWKPWCVYWSPSTGDLLVGLCYIHTETGKVTRYNQSGQLTQTMQHDNTGRGLYSVPIYITENNNGDVVVSDFWSGAVVVTERGGRHRFSYTGFFLGLRFRPCGICTDALSHILVCDHETDTVQILNKDGQFLSHLLTESQEMSEPRSLSYDVNTHCILVGSWYNNRVCVFRSIIRQDALTDESSVMESLSGIPTTGTEKTQQGNQCLLKLMSAPRLLQSLMLTGVDRCFHISCVTSDRVWVSDDENNLILTNTTGVPLHHVKDLCIYGSFDNSKKSSYWYIKKDLCHKVESLTTEIEKLQQLKESLPKLKFAKDYRKYFIGGLGSHTVNSENELIYIDWNYNINKLSKDMKTTTTFIQTTDSAWEPQCVYWSKSTGNLLVGMYHLRAMTGKIIQYNERGQLTQTIQQDNTGQGLYAYPDYITENNNGDVVVSDFDAVVVTERGGRHRFSYTGPPSGWEFRPCGICTDALSHILVCDGATKIVQMLNKDGQFLSHLLTESQEMVGPWSLSYDVNTHRLWVGSRDNNKVCVYRYITRQDSLTDEHRPCPDGESMFSLTPAVEWR